MREASKTTEDMAKVGLTNVHSFNLILGKFKWSDGRVYDGGWKAGKQHGEGTFISQDGETKRGEWKDGKRIKWITG